MVVYLCVLASLLCLSCGRRIWSAAADSKNVQWDLENASHDDGALRLLKASLFANNPATIRRLHLPVSSNVNRGRTALKRQLPAVNLRQSIPRMIDSGTAHRTYAGNAESEDEEVENDEYMLSNKGETHVTLPRHSQNEGVNALIDRTEKFMNDVLSGRVDPEMSQPSSRGYFKTRGRIVGNEDKVYANAHVDLGDIDVIGFDYDYTLVSYKPDVLYLIYDLARKALIDDLGYPEEILEGLPGYDPKFAVRGLAVDLQTAWICHLTYNYKVTAAFFGQERIDSRDVKRMYSSEKGGGSLTPDQRMKRLRPLNDIFSMEACLLADLVQVFRDKDIPFDARSVVNDVLKAVGSAHISGDLHRAVVGDLEKYLEPDAKRHLREMLVKLENGGKKMMLVSNSRFWYVDAGMKYVVGDDWQDFFEVVIAPAGKPAFYTQDRPFREVSKRTGRVKFKPITELVHGEVYCDGSVGELMKLKGWGYDAATGTYDGSRILYLGDSLFADLVDARRLYGWVTGAIVREIHHETRVHRSREWRQARFIWGALMHALRLAQEEMGIRTENTTEGQIPRSPADIKLLDALEGLAEEWCHKTNSYINPNFGSIFSCAKGFGTTTPSLFSMFMKRHVDLYTSRIENFRHYSPDHRFYPISSDIGNVHSTEPFTDNVLDYLI